jgi:hypothetical protein
VDVFEYSWSLMRALSEEAQDKGLDNVLDIGRALALGVEVLDARHLTDRLHNPVRADTRAGRHLRTNKGQNNITEGQSHEINKFGEGLL